MSPSAFPFDGDPDEDSLADPLQRRLILAQVVSTPMGAMTFQVLPLFVLRIGANVAQIGQFIAVLWIMDIVQFLVSSEVGRRNKKRWMVITYTLAALASTGYLFVASVRQSSGPSAALALLFVIAGAYNLMLSTALAAWSPYLRIMVRLNETGRFLGRFESLASAAFLASGFLASIFLGDRPELWRFTAIFLVAITGVFVRVALIAQLPMDRVATSPSLTERSWGGLLAPVRDPSMVRFTVSVFLLYALMWASRPLYPPFLSQVLGYSDAVIVLFQTALSAGIILFGSALGRLADRRGYLRMVALAASVGGAALLILIALPSSHPELAFVGLGMGVFITLGVAEAILQIAILRERFARSPKARASEYLGLSNAARGLGAAFGGIVGGALPAQLRFLGSGNNSLRLAFLPQAALLLIIAFGLALASRRAKTRNRER